MRGSFWLKKESLAETKRRHHVPYHLIPPLKSVLQIWKFRTQFVGKRLGQTRKPTNFRILNFQQLSIALERSDVDGYYCITIFFHLGNGKVGFLRYPESMGRPAAIFHWNPLDPMES